MDDNLKATLIILGISILVIGTILYVVSLYPVDAPESWEALANNTSLVLWEN